MFAEAQLLSHILSRFILTASALTLLATSRQTQADAPLCDSFRGPDVIQ